jgi:hypothetical protein
LLAALDKLKVVRPRPPRHDPSEQRQSRHAKKAASKYFFYDWDEWWETTGASLVEWQRHSIIKLLDKVQLFEIVETELEV